MTDRSGALAELAGELHDLSGGWGIPAAIQYSVDHLPGSITSHVGYDVAIAIGLLIGDLAGIVDEATDEIVEPAGDDTGADDPPRRAKEAEHEWVERV
ncbi:MAG: hypothetical protein Q4G43_13225, partial [Mobilicoccus sp.]|nr:hypothetical protein [Mobilicoccus sp.]